MRNEIESSEIVSGVHISQLSMGERVGYSLKLYAGNRMHARLFGRKVR